MEKGLPDQIRRAYGDVPSVLADLPNDDPHLAAVQEQARTSLLRQGYLTEEELDTLSVDEALEAAQQRLRAQVAGLHEQADTLARQGKDRQDRTPTAPRTLRQG